MTNFQKLWNNHPYPAGPCNFTNQCAIRMGVALQASGVNMSSFTGAKCWHGHSPKHILRAQELADWLKTSSTFGAPLRMSPGKTSAMSGKQGIVFIQNGWGPTDHIDLWDGSRMKGGEVDYLSRGDAIWFWEMS